MADSLFRTLAHLAALGLVEVANVRGEFACNSSSSHSIIVLPEGAEVGPGSSLDGEYGMGDFTLTSSTEKVRYMAAALSDSPATEALVARLRSELDEWSKDDYVDHQSTISPPLDLFGSVEQEFLSELVDLIRSPAVAILGGSDDGGSGHPLEDLPGTLDLGVVTSGGYRVRKDVGPDGQHWWVLFSQMDGTKIRLRMTPDSIRADLGGAEDGSSGFLPTKASSPELVDVKLTDRCPFELDCGFCYMGSTRKGAEGNPAHVQALVVALAEMGVFEIAFGGGEPTLWPHMLETMRLCRSVGVVPNFTTKNFALIRQQPDLLSLAGAVAFSINDRKSLHRLQKEFQSNFWMLRSKVTIQVIPEIVETEFLEELLEWADDESIRVTLLGYKETGRGGGFDGRLDRPVGFWIDLLRVRPGLRVAIDTTLAEVCQPQLEAAGVPSWCYHTQEGKFSLYVDAVTGRVGPSSYCDASAMEDLDLSAPDLVDTLATAFERY